MKKMILAGALTLAGITGATAFITETRLLPLLKNKSLQNFILCKLGVVLSKNLFSFKRDRNNSANSILLVTVFMTQIIILLDVILMVTAAFSLQKQMEICTFNFMHLTFTIVL